MVTPPVPRFEIWIPAVEAGLLPLHRLVEWADEQIAELPAPPLWLIEMSLARGVDGLYRAKEKVPEHAAPAAGENFDRHEIYLGCLYLAYEAGRLPMGRMLWEAGDYADGQGGHGIPDCETFYLLLNEIDGGGPTMPSARPLADRVRELFAPMAEQARAALVDLPGA